MNLHVQINVQTRISCRGPLKRKRRGGGERKRKAKHAAAARAVREERHSHGDDRDARGGAPGLFGFLNQALGMCMCGVCGV